MKRLERDLLLEIAGGASRRAARLNVEKRRGDITRKLWEHIFARWVGLALDCRYEGLPTNYDYREHEPVDDPVKLLAHAVAHVREFARGLAGHVCVAHFLDRPALCGVVVDNGDNGLTFHTVRQVYRDGPHNGGEFISYGMGGDEPGCLACLLPHPNPANIWRRINLAAYAWSTKRQPQYPLEDAFHAKIRWWDPLTRHVPAEAKSAIFPEVPSWRRCVNPYGEVGGCYPWCQCRHLGPRPMPVGDCGQLPLNRPWPRPAAATT